MELQYLHRMASPPEGQSPELMVLLHGYGSNKEDLFSFAFDLPERFEVVSFDAPFTTPYGGHSWYDINFMNAQKFNDEKQARESLTILLENIRLHCEKWNCPTQKVNLCGFSQGGILSYALALQHPFQFQKVCCLSSYPAPEIVGEIDKKSDFSSLQFFLSHGLEDAVIPIDWGRQGIALMEELSISYIFKEYREGHGINADNFRDFILFLMK